MLNPFEDMLERYTEQLESLQFDEKTIEDYQRNIRDFGGSLSLDDERGLFMIKGKIAVLKDVKARLQMIDNMITWDGK